MSPRPALRLLDTLPEKLLCVDDVASVLGVSAATVYKLCKAGQLAHVRVGNAIRFRKADVVAAGRPSSR